MKTKNFNPVFLSLLLVFGGIFVLTGPVACKNTSAERNIYNVTATTVELVDAAMRSWANYVTIETEKLKKLDDDWSAALQMAELAQKQKQVDAVYNEYQTHMQSLRSLWLMAYEVKTVDLDNPEEANAFMVKFLTTLGESDTFREQLLLLVHRYIN